MALGKEALRALYRKRAGLYDLTANLYYLIGFREAAYRRQAIAALALRPGDTVVEIGCGTGLNFGYLRRAVGETGQLIGVDLTDAMLRQARARVKRNHWRNVELVEADAARFSFPPRTKGVLSTFALTLVPEYERVIERAVRALAPGGRFVILDLKLPEQRPHWLVQLMVAITRPFGVSLDLADRRPWEALEKNFARVSVSEMYLGFAYLAVGEKEILDAEPPP